MIKGLAVAMVAILTFMNALYALNGNEGRRGEALRLYQEGLFQEMGTGNLDVAFNIYQDLANRYEDIHDVAAVANYHMGMIMDKKGNPKQAYIYFRLVTKQYADQTNVVKRVNLKLQEPPYAQWLGNNSDAQNTDSKKTSPSAPVEMTKTLPAEGAGETASPANTIPRWGIGVHTLGAHLRYSFGQQDRMVSELDLERMGAGWGLGARLQLMPQVKPVRSQLFFYPGLAVMMALEDGSEMTTTIGGYLGAEWLLEYRWGISLELGYNYGEQHDGNITTQTKGNFYLTYYF